MKNKLLLVGFCALSLLLSGCSTYNRTWYNQCHSKAWNIAESITQIQFVKDHSSKKLKEGKYYNYIDSGDTFPMLLVSGGLGTLTGNLLLDGLMFEAQTTRVGLSHKIFELVPSDSITDLQTTKAQLTKKYIEIFKKTAKELGYELRDERYQEQNKEDDFYATLVNEKLGCPNIPVIEGDKTNFLDRCFVSYLPYIEDKKYIVDKWLIADADPDNDKAYTPFSIRHVFWKPSQKLWEKGLYVEYSNAFYRQLAKNLPDNAFLLLAPRYLWNKEQTYLPPAVMTNKETYHYVKPEN